jgi:hypothetical protein
MLIFVQNKNISLKKKKKKPILVGISLTASPDRAFSHGRSLIDCSVLVFVCVLFCALVRPLVFVRVFARPTRPLDRSMPPMRLPYVRCTLPARLSRSRPPVPLCLTVAAPRPVPPLRRPTESQTVPPSEHALTPRPRATRIIIY